MKSWPASPSARACARYPPIAATSSAETYSPAPNTAWTTRLRRRAVVGFAVFDAAIPMPIPGCMTKSGAATVARPTASAGSGVG
ncbi:hypothetical protein D3C83_14350 [compost metagenome]